MSIYNYQITTIHRRAYVGSCSKKFDATASARQGPLMTLKMMDFIPAAYKSHRAPNERDVIAR